MHVHLHTGPRFGAHGIPSVPTTTRLSRLAQSILVRVIMLGMVVWIAFPFWWALTFSVKRTGDFFTAKVFPVLQFSPTLANWQGEVAAFVDFPGGLGRGLIQSTIIASATAALSLVIGLLAALGLLRRWRAGQSIVALVGLFLLPRLIPPLIVALPFTFLMRQVG